MDKKTTNLKFLNTMLAFGMLAIFIGFLIIVGFSGDSGILALSLWPLVLCLAGFIFLFCFIVFSRTAFKLFLGVMFTLSGVFSLLVSQKIIPWSMEEWWPMLVIFAGISLCCCCFINVRRVSIGYSFSALFMILLGVLFLFYSFDVITISLRELMVKIFPVILILAGFFLVVLYFQRKAIMRMLPEDAKRRIEESCESEQFQDENI